MLARTSRPLCSCSSVSQWALGHHRKHGLSEHRSARRELLCEFQRDSCQSFPGRFVWRLGPDRKSTRLNSSHANISYAVFCLKKKKQTTHVAWLYTSTRLTDIIRSS